MKILEKNIRKVLILFYYLRFLNLSVQVYSSIVRLGPGAEYIVSVSIVFRSRAKFVNKNIFQIKCVSYKCKNLPQP